MRNPWIIFSNIAIGTFLSTLESSSVNVALPTLAKDLVVDLPTIQWVVTGYLLTISALLLPSGRLGDIFGKEKVYRLGLFLLASGSFLCSLATNFTFLIAARIVEAFGSAMVMSTSMGIITSVFPKTSRGKALGLAGLVVGLGSMSGPVVGGFLVENFHWTSIFKLSMTIGLAAFIYSFWVFPGNIELQKISNGQKFDLVGAIILGLTLISLIFAISSLKNLSNTWLLITLFLSAIALGYVFYYDQLKKEQPLLNFTLFKHPVFLFGNLASLSSFIAMFTTIILMPFYLQEVLGKSPGESGSILMAFPVAMALIAPISGTLADKGEPHKLTVIGLGISTVGFGMLTFLGESSSVFYVVASMAIIGLGMGVFQSPNNSLVMSSVPPNFLGIAGGISATMRNFGMVLGTSLSVAIFTYLNNTVGDFIYSMSSVFWGTTAISAFGTIMAFRAGLLSLKKDREMANQS